MYVKSLISVSTAQERAIKARQKAAAASQRGFFVDGVFIATQKRKPTKLQKLEAALARVLDNYNACIRNGDPMVADFEAAAQKIAKQIAKVKAA